MRLEAAAILSRTQAQLETPVTLPGFPAGTFVKAAPAFDLFVPRQTFPMERGKDARLSVEIRTQGGFDRTVDLTIDGLPEGIASRDLPTSTPARAIGLSYELVAAPNAPLGCYPVTLLGRYKTMGRAQTFTIVLDRCAT